eukprot:scaffold26550_cov88-Skeletonema_marinoi.AAC.1
MDEMRSRTWVIYTNIMPSSMASSTKKVGTLWLNTPMAIYCACYTAVVMYYLDDISDKRNMRNHHKIE